MSAAPGFQNVALVPLGVTSLTIDRLGLFP